jgi:hypothetical protein
MSLRDDFEKWLKEALKKDGVNTDREIIVTAKPWRKYDVALDFSEDGKVKVDFYSVIRRDIRLQNAINYTVKCIKADRPLPIENPKEGESVKLF